ncbi:MAG: RNA polymerase sigma factor, partial [Flavobacteriales bacterium]
VALRERAFQIMMNKWHKVIYHFLRTMLGNHDDAADATQETFIQVLKSIHGFRRESKFSTWLFTIARRKALDSIRSNKRWSSMESLNEHNHIKSVLQNDIYFEGSEIEAMLQAAILTLPERQREIFILRYFDEISFAELSQILGISEGASKASYFHAKQKIARFVELNAE